MIVYYNTINGSILSIVDGFSSRNNPLNPSMDYIIVPDNKNLYSVDTAQDVDTGEYRIRVVNGSLQLDGFNYFTLSGLRTYYRTLLDTLYNSKLNLFGLIQFYKVQILRQRFDNGDSITYPTSFYRLDDGDEVVVNNASQLQDIEDYFLTQGLNHLDNVIAQYAAYKQAIEGASTIQEMTAIKFS